METVAFAVVPLVIAVGLVLALMGEDIRLRRRARRYRQLEYEGIEQLRRDPFPEDKAVEGAFLREPDGVPINGDDVLRAELYTARKHMTRRGKGAQCLL